MAISRVQAKSGSVDASASMTLTMPAAFTAGNFVLVWIASYYSPLPNPGQAYTVGDTNGSNTWVQRFDSGTADAGVTALWYAPAIQGGSYDLTINAAVSAYFEACAVEYSGLATSSVEDGFNHVQAGAPATTFGSGSISTANAADLLTGCVWTYKGTPSVTPNAGWTTVDTMSTGNFLYLVTVEQIVSSTGTYSFQGSISGDTGHTTAGIAGFAAATASGPAPGAGTVLLAGQSASINWTINMPDEL